MRLISFCALSLAVTIGAPIMPAVAQTAAPAAVGERVRIETPAQRGKFRYVGRVTAATSDSLQVQADGVGARTIPVRDIRSLEVSAGTTTNGRIGMLYGSAGGAVLGAIIGAVSYRAPGPCADIFCPEPEVGRGGNALAGALAGGVLGLAAGGIWGVSHRTERWIRRSAGRGATLGVVPTGHRGTALRVSVNFR